MDSHDQNRRGDGSFSKESETHEGLDSGVLHEPMDSCQTRGRFDEEKPKAHASLQAKALVEFIKKKFAGKKKVVILEELERERHLHSETNVSVEEVRREENYSDPFDDAAVLDVEVQDDFDERTISFRSILIGLMATVLGASISEVFMFKPVRINVDVLFLQIICLVTGHLFASIPGPDWWNPGPLTTKETVFSVIMAASASAGVSGVETIATQEVKFQKTMPVIVCMTTLLSSQLIGYGIAGLLRPVLVYPAKIVFPGVLPIVALFHSMSSQSKTNIKQLSFFKKTIWTVSLYEVIPTYLAPTLSAVSVWCLALPKTPQITNFFGGSLPAEGMGLMAFSGDWTLVGSYSPLFVPLLAQITDWLGYLASIIIFSWGHAANWFGGAHLPFISYNLLDRNGRQFNLTAAVFKNGTGDATVIDRVGSPFLSTTFVMSKAFLCMAASASITIGFYSSVTSHMEERRELRLHGKISKPCPHREITKKMRDFPTIGFVGILLAAISLAFISAHLADSGLSPLALFTALSISAVFCLASGYFYGTLGIYLLIAPVTPVVGGFLFPGNALGNMWFTLYGSTSVTQCVLMLKDLKLGNYMHLAPYTVVIAQLIGTVIGGLVHVVVMILIVTSQREVLLMPSGNGIFSGMKLSTTASNATAWGLFSHVLYYPGKIYAIVPYFLIIGFFFPIPFLIFNRLHPKSVLANFNSSLFLASIGQGVSGATSGRFTAMIIGFISQFYLRKYRFKWFKKYNYILCAALDGGTQITVVVLAFLLQGGAGFAVKMPNYFLNPRGTRDHCTLFSSNSAS